MMGPVCRWVVKLACVVVSRILFQVRVEGREHIPAGGPALLGFEPPDAFRWFPDSVLPACADPFSGLEAILRSSPAAMGVPARQIDSGGSRTVRGQAGDC